MAAQIEKGATLDWAIMCEDVRSEVGGKVSLMGLFDSIGAPRFPAMHPRLAVVASWRGGPGEFKSEIVLTAPTGETVQSLGVAPMKLTGQAQSHRHIAIALNVQFNSAGIYELRVLLEGQLRKSIPLTILSTEKPQ